ncbi:PadR family transcriptional regulator [Paenibacillus paeoniae]|uniref:PadR family transcriptional regulator n=1 Tax=Paenibacillus paeoniae TaxID=2292705 RepID=A0A371PGG0_9BACL|nr:PadR family transcriptional regulator [Paenibacillus paeoniae]REK74696.1 PadR family transcriptional regulator [Paenibacillus paeoniae]
MNIDWNEDEQLFLHHEDGREWSSSGRRFFSRGGVKYALLELLMIEPMHGYQMIKLLEEQSAGTYKPSAGSIYPTLQLLSDQGFVSSKKESGKKIFEITEDGQAFLQQEREERIDATVDNARCLESVGHPVAEEEQWPTRGRGRNRRLTPAGKELFHQLKAAERAAMEDGAKAERLRVILHELRDALHGLTEGK